MDEAGARKDTGSGRPRYSAAEVGALDLQTPHAACQVQDQLDLAPQKQNPIKA